MMSLLARCMCPGGHPLSWAGWLAAAAAALVVGYGTGRVGGRVSVNGGCRLPSQASRLVRVWFTAAASS